MDPPIDELLLWEVRLEDGVLLLNVQPVETLSQHDLLAGEGGALQQL